MKKKTPTFCHNHIVFIIVAQTMNSLFLDISRKEDATGRDLFNDKHERSDPSLWCYMLETWKLVGPYSILTTSKQGEIILNIKYLQSYWKVASL